MDKADHDLPERTLEFARRVVRCCKALPDDPINWDISLQLLRSGPSVGANYREATGARSRDETEF